MYEFKDNFFGIRTLAFEKEVHPGVSEGIGWGSILSSVRKISN